MKRAKRFMCSKAPRTSAQNGYTRTRKRSRTSSAGGDGLTVNYPPKRSKVRFDIPPRSGSPRNCRKAAESTRVPKLNYGSLQNAVVLAPFHTLKSRFQTKLANLYAHEKIKKIDRKSKMAKMQNASFQYDVIEMKPQGSPVKKELRVSKKAKQSRSPSYCQCRTQAKKEEERTNRKKGTRKKKAQGEGPSRWLPRPWGRMEGGKKKPSLSNLHNEVAPRVDFYLADEPFVFSDTDPRSSAMSSRSKNDSLSDSASCLEGPFPISNTSCNSHLKKFVRDRDRSTSARGCRRKTSTRKSSKKTKDKFLPKPNADSSRHLIVRLEKKNSDEHIVHFLDREPRVRAVPSVQSSHHLQPLRRQGRAKEKKTENDRVATYYLRSVSSSKEQIFSEGDREFPSSEQRGQGQSRELEFEVGKVPQMEVATQVGGSGPEGGASSEKAHSKSRPRESAPDPLRAGVSQDRVVEENFPQASTPPYPEGPGCDPELPDDILLPPRMTSVENPTILADGRQRQPGLVLPGERSDSDLTELANGLRDGFQDFAGSQELQDKESDFIFGPRNTASRLGGSCEFSFGLGSLFPEDED